MDKKRSRHVVPNPDGGWDVRAPGAVRISEHTDTQEQAIDRARAIVANAGGGEVVIHGQDGRVRDSASVGRVSVVGSGAVGIDVKAAKAPLTTGTASPTQSVGGAWFDTLEITTRPDGVLINGVLINGLSTEDAVDAVRLLRAARLLQYQSGTTAARGLLQTMAAANVELIPPASVDQARRLANLRRTLLSTPVFTNETLGEVRSDTNPSTTRTWVSRARDRGKLFTVKLEGRTMIPAFQLTEAGSTRDEYTPALVPLLEAELDGWTIWTWLTSPTPLLSGGVPADLVTKAPERVGNAAQRFASSRRSAA